MLSSPFLCLFKDFHFKKLKVKALVSKNKVSSCLHVEKKLIFDFLTDGSL